MSEAKSTWEGARPNPLEDPRFSEIQSPLHSNAALKRYTELGPYDDPTGDLAEFLSLAAEVGRVDRWDFYALYLTDERIQGLYDCNMQYQFEENISQDMDLMEEDVAGMEAGGHDLTREGLRSLATILDRVDDERAAPLRARVERLLLDA